MLGFATSLLLLLPAQGQDQERSPSPEEVRAAVASIREALRGADEALKQRSLRAAADVPAPAVVDAVEEGLRDEAAGVRRAAVEGLRWMPHPDALEALHRLLARDRRLEDDPELAAAVLRAIGQHADPSSIEPLAERAFRADHRPSIEARLFGLGRIRDARAVEALLRIARRTDAKLVRHFREEFRLSLAVLTGADLGPEPAAWQRWWDEHAKDFRATHERPALPRWMEERWVRYWEIEDELRSRPRREDRGREDPQRAGERRDARREP